MAGVLIVENDSRSAQMIQTLLHPLPCEVATTLHDGLARASQGWAAVLLDMTLGVRDPITPMRKVLEGTGAALVLLTDGDEDHIQRLHESEGLIVLSKASLQQAAADYVGGRVKSALSALALLGV